MKVKYQALIALALGASSIASAAPIQITPNLDVELQPFIVAGGPPDTPANRVDPNVAASPFNGVVSINIRFNVGTPQQSSFICTGSMITPTHALTAAHCVDENGQGKVIDLTKGDVRIILNNQDPFSNPADIYVAKRVTINPNYNGFGLCGPSGGGSVVFGPDSCLNDDIAIVELVRAVPDTVTKYGLSAYGPAEGSTFTMVGYGTSGDGINGYNVSPSFFVKRDGANVWDLSDTDDETGNNPASPQEVWYYDFDGTAFGYNRDFNCEAFGVCSAQLANDVETHLGGGDSGGPSFMRDANGNYILVANNTFGGNACGWPDGNGGPTPCRNGDFGDVGGGVLLYSYFEWIRNQTPEPGSIALLGLALLSLAGIRRRRQD